MNPEQYWIERGADVIGKDVLADKLQARQANTYQTLAKHIRLQAPLNVLDVGCNFGVLHWWLDLIDYRGGYTGVDSNPYALEFGQSLGHRVQLGNLRKLDYIDRAFDCVVVKDVLEHLESYEPLTEAFRVARLQVLVSVYIPWTNQPSKIEKQVEGFYTNTYNQQEVVAFAASCGFGLIETLPALEANGTPNAIYVFRRVKP